MDRTGIVSRLRAAAALAAVLAATPAPAADWPMRCELLEPEWRLALAKGHVFGGIDGWYPVPEETNEHRAAFLFGTGSEVVFGRAQCISGWVAEVIVYGQSADEDDYELTVTEFVAALLSTMGAETSGSKTAVQGLLSLSAGELNGRQYDGEHDAVVRRSDTFAGGRAKVSVTMYREGATVRITPPAFYRDDPS